MPKRKVVLTNIEVEIELDDLDLHRVVLIDPVSLQASLQKSVDNHAKNALQHPKDSYMRGYHEGASERFGMLLHHIQDRTKAATYNMVMHPRKGAQREVFLVTELR